MRHLLLSQAEISNALVCEADKAKSVGLMTYNFVAGNETYLQRMRDLRLIVGVSPDDERSARAESRLQSFVNVCRLLGLRHRVRLLPKSHVKLAVFWTRRDQGYYRAVLTTMNGVVPRDFKEIGILLSNKLAAELSLYFEDRWKEAIPVNPLDLNAIKVALASGVFEVKETT